MLPFLWHFGYLYTLFSSFSLYVSPFPEITETPTSANREVLGDTIMFRGVQIGSSAVYQCNASNQHGYLLANAFVSVLGETREGGRPCSGRVVGTEIS